MKILREQSSTALRSFASRQGEEVFDVKLKRLNERVTPLFSSEDDVIHRTNRGSRILVRDTLHRHNCSALHHPKQYNFGSIQLVLLESYP